MIRFAGIYHGEYGHSDKKATALDKMLDIMNLEAGLEKSKPAQGKLVGGFLATKKKHSTAHFLHHASSTSILFDGSIYNLDVLCHTLDIPKVGAAELLFHAYQKWGKDCLHHFEGRWAFLMFQPAIGLWAARDRFGVKPLYYARHNGNWLFASEQKAFLGVPDFKTSLNQEIVFDYFFRFKVANQEQDLLKHVFQLMPACQMQISPSGELIEKSQWYRLKYLTKFHSFNTDKNSDYQEFIYQRLQSNINNRLNTHNSEKPGTLLSGGLDSSLIAALMADRGPVTGVTAVYPGQIIDEDSWAAKVVNHLDINWLKIQPDLDQVRDQWKSFYFSQDAPTYSFGTFNQFALLKASKKTGLDAVFDGQAADALFAGHNFFVPAFWRELWKAGQMKLLRNEIDAFDGSNANAFSYYLRNWMKYSFLPNRTSGTRRFIRSYLDSSNNFFNPTFLKANQHRMKLDAGDHFSSVNKMLWEEYMKGEVLSSMKNIDRAASWHGIDFICPFVDDHKLVEYAFEIPAVYKIRHNQTKYLLREVARRVLPKQVVDRNDKMGLLAPTNNWLSALRMEMKDYFLDLDPAIFNVDQLLRDYDQFFNVDGQIENFKVYKFMGFALWLAAINSYTGRAL